MAYNPQNPNGQVSKANSAPVVLANDQVGTAGTAAADVMTIQGIAGMTPVQVTSTPSGTGTQTVSGTVTVQQATAANLNATVTATDLDIRDLAFSTDKVDASGSSVSISGSVAVTGPLTDAQLRATAVPTSLSSSLPAGTNSIGVLGANSGTDIGDVTINNAAGASAVNIQDGGNSITVDGSVSITDVATNGVDSRQFISAAGTNETQVKTGQGKVVGWYIYNSADTHRKVAFYDKTTTVVPSSDSPVFALVIPSFSGANCSFPTGINFATGIRVRTVTGIPNDNNDNVSANDLAVNIFYK